MMMTSCSPGWIKFVEQFYPEMMPNLSTCKSPQQMMGAIIKTFYAEREKLDPKKIVSVSIMPVAVAWSPLYVTDALIAWSLLASSI